MYSESYILGYLSRSFGLTFDDIQKIITGNLILEKTPEEIKNFIFNDCNYRTTILRNIANLGVDINQFSALVKIDQKLLNSEIDNFNFWFNTIDFRAKSNINLRRILLQFLDNKANYKKIAEILNVSISTIQNDRLNLKKK